MSLLLEALKKAERAKEEGQRRAMEEDPDGAEEQVTAGKHVRTRDELPDISAPLEMSSDDLRADPPTAGRAEPRLEVQSEPGQGLQIESYDSPQPEPRREPTPAPRAAAPPPAAKREPVAAPSSDRTQAKKVFEAKFREPNPKLPFYIVMGLLGVFAVGTVVYFWYQLRPPPSLVNPNPPRAADEKAVAPAPLPPQPAAAADPAPKAPAIPGLPGAAPTLAGSGTPPAVPEAAVPTAAAPAAPTPTTAPKPMAAAPGPAPAAPAPPRALAAASRPGTRSAEPAPAAASRRTDSARLEVRAPVVRIHPRVAAAYAHYQAGRLDDARQDYALALRDEPINRDALLGLAATELRSGRLEDAARHYRRVLEIDPRDPFAHAGLLALAGPGEDPVRAESRVKSLLATDPQAEVLYFSLGNQYAEQARWPDAQQAYFRALSADPDNPDYAFNLAISLDQLRQSKAALQYYRRALELAGRRPPSFDPQAARIRIEELSR